MKYTILALTMLLAGCTSGSNSELTQVKHDLRFTTEQLESCQASLETYRGGGSSNTQESQSETQAEPQKPAEPEYRDVTVYHVEIGNKTVRCMTRDDGNDESAACGTKFSDCDGDYIYRCLQNVKYRTTEEKQEIKE